LGPRAEFKLPAKIPVVTAAVVTPGLIDAHCVVPLSGALNFKKADQDHDEISDPNQADLRVLDGFNPSEPLLEFVRRHGVTVIHAMRGPANVIAGQTGIFRTHGRTAEQMAIRFPAGLLVNLGEIPKSTYSGRLPSTRMGTASLVRQAFTQGQNQLRKKKAAEENPEAHTSPRGLDANPKLDALAPYLQGKLPGFFKAHRADDL